MTISATNQGLKPGVCTSSNRPANPYDGMMIYETDTDRTLIWDNSAWVLISNPVRTGVTDNGSLVLGKNVSTEAVSLEIGNGRSGSGYAFIDLVGDTTYSDYGFRLIRNNQGQNTSSEIVHKGTGPLNIIATEAGSISLRTSGNEALAIDSAGRVATPLQPRFLASRSGNLSYSGGSTVVFNATTYNVGSHYSTTTGLFTAPVAGVYVFDAGIYQSVAIQQMWFVINTNRERSFVLDHTANSANMAGSGHVYLASGDTIGIASWSGGVSLTIYENSHHTFFRGALVG